MTVALLVGAVLVVVGLTELILEWIPLRFGIAEWEFSTAVTTFNRLPLLSVGLAFLAAAGFGSDKRGLRLGVGGIAIIIALVIALFLGLFSLAAPPAFRGIAKATAEQQFGFKKGVVKTMIQGLSYLAMYGSLGVICLRRK